MRWTLYSIVLFFAFAGTARIGLYAINRITFGKRHETTYMSAGFPAIPPILLLLTLLYWPLYKGIERGEWSGWSFAGAVWLAVAASAGFWWIARRWWQLRHPVVIEGIRSYEPQQFRIRKAHIPFMWLRKLGAHNDLYDLEVTAHDILIPDLPPQFEGYRIAFLTDTHVASFVRPEYYLRIVQATNAFNPDLVLLGGDFVTWRRHVPLMAEVLVGQLRAKDGIYSVLGNHDYWSDRDDVVAALTVLGVHFIVDRALELRRDGAAIDLIGLDEIYRGDPDVEGVFSKIRFDRPCIGLSHHPDIIDMLDGRRIDLLLCGHTHGWQIRFPFFGAVVVPSAHETRYAAGFFRQGDVLMYVSRGIGSIPPVRILCRPEVATFTLRRA